MSVSRMPNIMPTDISLCSIQFEYCTFLCAYIFLNLVPLWFSNISIASTLLLCLNSPALPCPFVLPNSRLLHLKFYTCIYAVRIYVCIDILSLFIIIHMNICTGLTAGDWTTNAGCFLLLETNPPSLCSYWVPSHLHTYWAGGRGSFPCHAV